MVVQGSAVVRTDNRAPFSADLLPRVQAVDGVADAVGGVEGSAQLIKPDGKAVTTGGAPAQGFSWDGDTPLNPLTITDGRARGGRRDDRREGHGRRSRFEVGRPCG